MQLQNSTINFDTLWQKASLFSLFIVIVSCMKLKRKCRIPDRWSPPATKVPCKSDTRPLPFRLSTRRRDVKLFLNSTVCKQTISTIQKKTQDLQLRFTCGCGQSKMSEMPTVLHPWRMLVQGVVFHVSVEHCVVNLLPFLRLTLSISLQINWGYRTSPSFPGAGLQALKVLVAFGGKKNTRIYENLQHQLWNKISMFHTTCSLLPNVICVGTRTERCTAKRRWGEGTLTRLNKKTWLSLVSVDAPLGLLGDRLLRCLTKQLLHSTRHNEEALDTVPPQKQTCIALSVCSCIVLYGVTMITYAMNICICGISM